MLNGFQAVPSWLECEAIPQPIRKRLTWVADYHHPRSALLGLVSAMYSLGGIVALPFVPFVVDTFGRRCSILIGSILMMVGSVLQGAALNRK